MDKKHLETILTGVAEGNKSVEDGMRELKHLYFEELKYASIDHCRALRSGYPETVFCQGKTSAQIAGIMEKLAEKNQRIMGTRAKKEDFDAVKQVIPDAVYYEEARMIVINREPVVVSEKTIMVVTAGTADIPVAEEAVITAEVLGNKVERIYDVGVAGVHRLFANLDKIRSANVVIVVAGMEGALASVVGGLVDKPVIAVPTSVGYGANLGGLATLLSMLNSCANGVGVVNIDNGYGAAYLASNINRL